MALPLGDVEPPPAPEGHCSREGQEEIPGEVLFPVLGVHFWCTHITIHVLYLNNILMGGVHVALAGPRGLAWPWPHSKAILEVWQLGVQGLALPLATP